MEPIRIFKGNDTNFNDGKFLTFTVTGDIDLSDFSGIFTLGSFAKPGSLADGKMEVVIPAAVTAQFPLGSMCGTFQLVDNKMRVATVTNTIPFLITNEVFTPTPDVVELETPEGYPVDLSVELYFASGNYNDLNNLPQINGVTLKGNKTASALGLTSPADLQPITQDVAQLQTDLAGKQTALNAAQLAAANSGIDSQKVQQIAQNAQDIDTINAVIPSQASEQNQLADKGFVNSTVQTSTAHFRGNWETYAAIPTDASLYPADEFGVREPGPNDYLVVRADETQDGGTWRYKYTGSWAVNGKNGWQVEYEVNETPLTAAQLAALNSGITGTKVSGYDEHVANTLIHVTAEQKSVWNAKQDPLIAGRNMSITPVAQPIIDENTVQLWHLDDTLKEEISGAVGTAGGSPSYAEGKFGNSLSNSGWITGSTEIEGLDSNTTSFTADFWFMPLSFNASDSYCAVGLYSDGDSNVLFRNSNTIILGRNISGTGAEKTITLSESALALNTWYHIALVSDNSNNRIYLFLDGVLVDSWTRSARSQHIQFAYVGYRGRVDEVRISNVARWTSGFTPFSTPYGTQSGQTQYSVNCLIDPSSFVPASQKGSANGVATLDANGQITDGQINYATAARVGGIKQTFDAATGTWVVITEEV